MTSIVDTLRHASRAELRARIVAGHPVDPGAIEGWAYRGTSLGLPRVVERLTWRTFQKTFYRQPVTGRLIGWNVRLEQDGLDAPSRPKRTPGGEPVTTWHYEVIAPDGLPTPRGFDRGLLIDYGRGANPPLDPIRWSRDPLVAVEAGSADLLLGVTYVALGRLCIETPTYFLLERESRIDFVPAAAGARRSPAITLTSVEKRWAEQLFDAVTGAGVDPSVPALAGSDTSAFWRALDDAPPVYVGPGLRAMVHALTFLPLTTPGLRRPLFALPPAERVAFIERLADDPRFAVRHMLSTLKILACFALFEDDRARRRFAGADADADADADAGARERLA
jgi:hypothetical protein